jgi:hypothetical protein
MITYIFKIPIYTTRLKWLNTIVFLSVISSLLVLGDKTLGLECLLQLCQNLAFPFICALFFVPKRLSLSSDYQLRQGALLGVLVGGIGATTRMAPYAFNYYFVNRSNAPQLPTTFTGRLIYISTGIIIWTVSIAFSAIAGLAGIALQRYIKPNDKDSN